MLNSRAFTGSLATAGALIAFGSVSRSTQAAPGAILSLAIPSSGELIPVIGMGSRITFNVGDDKALRDGRVKVL